MIAVFTVMTIMLFREVLSFTKLNFKRLLVTLTEILLDLSEKERKVII